MVGFKKTIISTIRKLDILLIHSAKHVKYQEVFRAELFYNSNFLIKDSSQSAIYIL